MKKKIFVFIVYFYLDYMNKFKQNMIPIRLSLLLNEFINPKAEGNTK